MPTLIFSLLGPLQIEHHRLGAITLTNRKAIGLLAYLLIESRDAHSREFLHALLWPDLPTAAAQNNLRVTWAYLQKTLALGDSEAEPPLIGNRLTLRFNLLSDHGLDVARFYEWIETCRRHAHPDPHNCPECTVQLAQALELVRGEFLVGFSLADCLEFDEWLVMQREQIHVNVTWALEQLAVFHEGAGQLTQAEGVIRRLLEQDPLNETAYRQLMRVLARMGRRGAALDVYETCRRMLATGLGMAPTMETVMFAEQVRALAPLEPPATKALLPAAFTRFFGRKQESARLVDLLSRRTVRVVTLAGAGGVGKTRLAIEVAQRLASDFAYEVFFVELAGIASGSTVEDAVAAALRLPTVTGRSSTSAIVDYLRDKSALLVLDNCEHVVTACARLVETLCRDVVGLTLLATSRIPLHLAAEHVVRLEPFATPAISGGERLAVADALRFDSIQLFVNRAAEALIHFTLTDANVPVVAQICRRLDGIPLAIEIAAAQVRMLPVEAIAERLRQRFDWLNRRAATIVPRQRTLHTLIDWSDGLLSAPARGLLRRLSLFAGGWTLEAAEAISTPGAPSAQSLAELVDHSLVLFGNDTRRSRYGMHESVRQYAREYLRGSDEEEDALERHARYYAGLVSRTLENRSRQTQSHRPQTLEEDHDNLRVAFAWLLEKDHEQALALVAQMGALAFWELGGYFQEGRRWLRRALDRTEGVHSVFRARALLAAADLSSAISDFDYGLRCAGQARDLFQQLNDPWGEVDARLSVCVLAGLADGRANLQPEVEEILEKAEQTGYRAGNAKARYMLGSIAFAADEPEAAIAYLLPAVTLWREIRNAQELARTLNTLGAALLEIGEFTAAGQAFRECREISQSLGYRRGVALANHNLGETAYKMGEFASARELLRESLRVRHELALPRGYTYSFELLAQVNESEARYAEAVQLWAAADALRARVGAPLEPVAMKHAEAARARLRARLGDVAFDLEWSRGTHMNTAEAVALALN